MSDTNFIDDRHTLYCGWVMGLALRNGLPAEPGVDEHGDYTPHLIMKLPEGHTLSLSIPYPPDDWAMIPEPERNPDAQTDTAASGHAEGDALQPPQG